LHFIAAESNQSFWGKPYQQLNYYDWEIAEITDRACDNGEEALWRSGISEKQLSPLKQVSAHTEFQTG
jgi:hypothetical protein